MSSQQCVHTQSVAICPTYVSALARYAQAVNLEPTSAVYHLKVGWIYELMNFEDKAKNEFAKALLLDPTNLKNRIYLAEYFLSKGEEVNAFYHACWVEIISEDFSLGDYESAARKFTQEFRQGSYSKISFNEMQFLLSLTKEDFPLRLEYPLGLRIRAAGQDILEAGVYLDYLPQGNKVPFSLEINQRDENVFIFGASDLYSLAKDYAKQKRWNVSGIYLERVEIKPISTGIIEKIQLVFNY